MENLMRHRIIGTLVWLSVAAIVLPFVMDGAGLKDLDKQHSPINMPIPVAVKPVQIEAVDTVKPITINEPASTSKQQPIKQQKAKTQTALDAQGLPKSWVVQLASFKKQDNAKKLRNKLLKAKYKAYLQTKDANYRVLVGPVNTRDEADKLQAKLKQDYKLPGIVVAYKVDQ
jgi:DedD protein